MGGPPQAGPEWTSLPRAEERPELPLALELVELPIGRDAAEAVPDDGGVGLVDALSNGCHPKCVQPALPP